MSGQIELQVSWSRRDISFLLRSSHAPHQCRATQLQEQLRQIENRPRDEAGPLRARQQKLNFDYRRVQKLFAALKDEAMVTLEAAGIPRYDIFA